MGRERDPSRRVALAELIAASQIENLPIWLDTSALLAYLENSHPNGTVVGSLVEHPGIICGISTITVAETIAGPARNGDELAARRLINGLLRLPRLQIEPFTMDAASSAAWLRAGQGLKFPDAGIIASARVARAVCIIGNDHRWRNKPLGLPFLLLDELR